MADGLLVARLGAGDDEAIAEAFDRYAAAVYAAARRVLVDRSAAQDVVQDVFVTLWQRPDRYDEARGPLRSYLTVLAQRRALDVLRSELRRTARERRHELGPPEQVTPAQAADAIAVADVVREAVITLPPEQRQVVELAYFRGLTYRQVAVAIGIPEGTAKSRLRLALGRLESILDRELLETW